MKDRFSRWFLLSGNRYGVTLVILAVMGVVVLVPDLTRLTIHNTTPLIYIASALIGGNTTLITVVVAINQVILSQELESPGSLRDEIDRIAEFRQAALDQPAPPTQPTDFLQRLLQQTREHARSLEEELPDSADGTNERLLRTLPEQCERLGDQLETESENLSTVVVPSLGIDYGDYIHDCSRLRSKYEEESHEQLYTTLDALSSDLENLAIARQYFTTAFMKEELATLSRSLLYLGIVAASVPIALLYQLSTYSSASPPMPELFALTVLTTVIGLIPLALLIAFVLRIATIAQFMAAITPFKT